MKSGGSQWASGHIRRALEAGIAEPTPNSRASYEAVVTTARGPVPGHDHWLPDQLRMAQELNGHVERVHVEMRDRAGHKPIVRPRSARAQRPICTPIRSGIPAMNFETGSGSRPVSSASSLRMKASRTIAPPM